MAKHLTLRGNIYYVTARVNGRRVSRSLNTSNREEAARRARQVVRAAVAGKWQVLDDTRSRVTRRIWTVDEYCTRFRTLAAARWREVGEPAARTVASYENALRYVLAHGTASDHVGALSLSTLGRPVLKSFVAATVTATDFVQAERQRRSAASYIRQARAMFAGWAIEEMREDPLPDLAGFLRGRVVEAQAVRYVLPDAGLIGSTIEAARTALRAAQPDLYAAWLLCYDLGLRAGEAAAAEWSWVVERVEPTGSRRYIHIAVQSDWAPKSQRGSRDVPIAVSVWQHLDAGRRPGSRWILAGESQLARAAVVKRGLAQWMRARGWQRELYPKCAHELRKLIGSEWYTRYGAEVAAKWLGHASVATTCRYYADLTRHPAPIEIDQNACREK